MRLLSMALRNVGRNRHRTVTTVGAMAFAGALMIFYMSLINGFVGVMERNATGINTGEIQIHAMGYRDDPDLYKRVEDHEKLLRKLTDAGFFAAPRLYGFGLAASGASSAGVTLRGVDIKRERNVTWLNRHVMSGQWLSGGDPKGVVIGGKLARSLDVKTGAEIVVLSQAADGSMANDLYRVRGILKFAGEAIDRSAFLMPASSFRKLMMVPEGASEIAVKRAGGALSLEEETAKVAAIAGGYETKNWKELNPVISRMLDMVGSVQLVMVLITYTAIAMVTLNAMLMSVFERIREFGVMKALGVSPFQIVSLVFTEAMIQAAMACAIALAMGLSVSYYFEDHGIDFTSIAGGTDLGSISGVAFDAVWYTKVTAEAAVVPLAVLVIIVMLAIIYPSVKAAVINPVKAIHHI